MNPEMRQWLTDNVGEVQPTEPTGALPIRRTLTESYSETERSLEYSSEYHIIRVVASRRNHKSDTATMLRKLAAWLEATPDPMFHDGTSNDPWGDPT